MVQTSIPLRGRRTDGGWQVHGDGARVTPNANGILAFFNLDFEVHVLPRAPEPVAFDEFGEGLSCGLVLLLAGPLEVLAPLAPPLCFPIP